MWVTQSDVACEASVSVRSMSKERGTRVAESQIKAARKMAKVKESTLQETIAFADKRKSLLVIQIQEVLQIKRPETLI